MTEPETIAKKNSSTASEPVQEGGPGLQHAAERINKLASESMEAIRDTSHQCRSQLIDASTHAINHIRNRPIQSILIAALLGATAVTLASLFRRRH